MHPAVLGRRAPVAALRASRVSIVVRIVPPGRRCAHGCGPHAKSSDGARKSSPPPKPARRRLPDRPHGRWPLAARCATFVNGENRNDRRDCTRNSNKSPNQFIINGLDIQKITDALLAPIYSPSLRDPRRTRLFSTPQLKTNQRIAFAKSSD
ncbi:hypothetical protein [Burkholderia territorii]|uniref:hypothetical protein n=1 Tax=Burkholderia territorii TaxID=1503055 RepID=UPI0018C8C734|nr:hypothetical protein [Burkholderia territorii]